MTEEIMQPNDFHIVTCRFCGKVIDCSRYFPGDCDCEEWKRRHALWLEDYRNSADYQEPLSEEEYEKKYPVTFKGECQVEDQTLKLEARAYEDGEGLTVWKPFKKRDGDDEDIGDSGICFDFTDKDAKALYRLLAQYLIKKVSQENCGEKNSGVNE
jgi:hypothetical protein